MWFTCIFVGCGSSCVFALLGHKLNNWRFICTEIDDTNLRYARENVEANKLSEHVTGTLYVWKDVKMVSASPQVVCFYCIFIGFYFILIYCTDIHVDSFVECNHAESLMQWIEVCDRGVGLWIQLVIAVLLNTWGIVSYIVNSKVTQLPGTCSYCHFSHLLLVA